jgi:signal peptidase I
MDENKTSTQPEETNNLTPGSGMKSGRRLSFIFETVKFIVISLLIVVPFRYFIAQPFVVSGASMDPTFKNGEYLIVDEISYRFDDPKRGDVIVFKYPENPKKYFIKRIVGLPGESVLIKDGIVTIKRQDIEDLVLTEEYVTNTSRDNYSRDLKDGEYFVMGDNRPNSLDSRSWGPLSKEMIIGKPFVRLFPITRLNFFPGVERK